MRKIVLVRHGRSAHVHAGWIDVSGFRRWREAYEAAGIDAREVPPPELREVAASGFVVASDVRRAMESARLLAPDADVLTSPLLRELELPPPELGAFRLPLLGWMLAIAMRIAVRAHVHVSDAERERVRDAARWLTAMAEERDTIVAVTHGSFRWLLAKTLEAEGWQRADPQRRSAHWSAWSFARSGA